MPGFDADAWVAAHAPWTVTLEGTTYTAEPVSYPVLLGFQEALHRAERQRDGPGSLAATRRLWRAAFPWRPSMAWRGDPVARLLRLPPKAHEAALIDFFVFLGVEPSAPSRSGRSGSSAGGTPSPSASG